MKLFIRMKRYRSLLIIPGILVCFLFLIFFPSLKWINGLKRQIDDFNMALVDTQDDSAKIQPFKKREKIHLEKLRSLIDLKLPELGNPEDRIGLFSRFQEELFERASDCGINDILITSGFGSSALGRMGESKKGDWLVDTAFAELKTVLVEKHSRQPSTFGQLFSYVGERIDWIPIDLILSESATVAARLINRLPWSQFVIDLKRVQTVAVDDATVVILSCRLYFREKYSGTKKSDVPDFEDIINRHSELLLREIEVGPELNHLRRELPMAFGEDLFKKINHR